MRWKFAFGLASDDLFFVTTRRERARATGAPFRSKVTTFLDEDEFLGHLIRAGLREDQTTRLVLAVLLSVAKPVAPPPWTVVDLSQRQMEILHLAGPGIEEEAAENLSGKDLYLRAARSGSLPQLYDLMMHAPTALAMLLGPEHRYSFVNVRYAELMGMKSIASALGTSALDRYVGSQRSSLADVLNRVYQTGKPHVGVEALTSSFHEDSGSFQERYYDTVCQPITNAYGDIAGIMEQTTDVTEMVLARAVQENREQLLYRQWAELDTIYRNAPIGMMLLDTREFRILRLNERQAEIIGGSVAELLGVPLLAVAYEVAGARDLLERVMEGESAVNQMFEGRLLSSPEVLRRWVVSVAPAYSASGKVETIMLVSQEISQEMTREEMLPVTQAGAEENAPSDVAVMV